MWRWCCYCVWFYSTGANPPTGLSATQEGPTSIRVSWTAPVSLAAVTGYRISYSGGNNSGSVDVGASATEHTITIPQPQSPLTYSIIIMTQSTNLPISTVDTTVTVGKQTLLNSSLYLYILIIRLTHANVWESMGKPCSCMQFIKSCIFYCKSHENLYLYYKSRENSCQVLQVKHTASEGAIKSKVRLIKS